MQTFIDYTASAQRRTVLRLILGSAFAVVWCLAGFWILGGTEISQFTVTPTNMIGLFFVASGALALLSEFFFFLRSGGTQGQWHIVLTDTSLEWSVPKHGFGREESFALQLTEIKHIERQYLDDMETQFWIVTLTGRKIRLRHYSGISLNDVFTQFQNAGVAGKTARAE